jgi:hypothetical protein
MKTNFSYLIVAIVFIVVIAFSLTTTISYVPYRKNTFFSKEFPYEGFHGMEYGNTAGNVMDSYTSFLINGSGVDCKKVYGFDGLFCKPYSADSQLDIYSQAKGDISCIGSSSSLSNSKGGLCLDAKQKAMLTTRGGNATGRDSEIGK